MKNFILFISILFLSSCNFNAKSSKTQDLSEKNIEKASDSFKKGSRNFYNSLKTYLPKSSQ
jgi:hypothetical protein